MVGFVLGVPEPLGNRRFLCETHPRMRRILLVLAVGLALPPSALAHPVRSAIFFYPWYSNPAHDGGYTHWQQGQHDPPFDVASDYFPARGAYSSADPRVLRAQMRDIARAGVDEVVSSWWGRGSPEDGVIGPSSSGPTEPRTRVRGRRACRCSRS